MLAMGLEPAYVRPVKALSLVMFCCHFLRVDSGGALPVFP